MEYCDLSQSFGWKDVQSSGCGIGDDCLEHWDVKGEGLAAAGRCG